MTEAEQLAKAWVEARGFEWDGGKRWPDNIAIAQRVIDAGWRFTPPEPPDPAEQIADAWRWPASSEVQAPDDVMPEAIRRLIDDGWITPGPACEGYVPTLDPLVQAVLDAYDRFHGNIGGVTPVVQAVRALREAQP